MRSSAPVKVLSATVTKKPVAKKPVAKKPLGKSAGSAAKNAWVAGAEGFDESKFYGPDRVLFLPDGLLDRNDVPDYLDGSLAGDYGYDPLGLGSDTAQVEKYREYELIHARWAMLGAFGAIVPELIDRSGGNIPGAVWWQTGAVQLANEPLAYLGSVPTLPLAANAAITVGAFFFLERFRADGGEQNGIPAIFPNGPGADKLYPGGDFDPLGLADDPTAFAELKVKEIKNGRLAMVAMLAFAAQAATTGAGPIANIQAHLSGPFENNLLTVLRAGDRPPSL